MMQSFPHHSRRSQQGRLREANRNREPRLSQGLRPNRGPRLLLQPRSNRHPALRHLLQGLHSQIPRRGC